MYFQAQKQKEELIAESANVVNVARQVQGILSNLGIHDPVINKAVEVSSVAQSALSAALTGNWLGAISSITSLFGGGVDPEAERLAQIMGYLQQMNQTLNKIVDLQIKTLQAIQALSDQVADMDKRLNQRLDRIDFEVKVISENLRSVMWSILPAMQRGMAGSNCARDRKLRRGFTNICELSRCSRICGRKRGKGHRLC